MCYDAIHGLGGLMCSIDTTPPRRVQYTWVYRYISSFYTRLTKSANNAAQLVATQLSTSSLPNFHIGKDTTICRLLGSLVGWTSGSWVSWVVVSRSEQIGDTQSQSSSAIKQYNFLRFVLFYLQHAVWINTEIISQVQFRTYFGK